MTPADKRMTELLDKWLTSLELHLKYADLSDAAYATVQPWPEHDRPIRWIIEVAKQKTLELKGQHETRIAMGDGKFAEALELMAFLANLVGSQHIQRFIPLAEPEKERKVSGSASSGGKAGATASVQSRPKDTAGMESTREMPRLQAAGAASTRKPTETTPAARQASAKNLGKAARKSAVPSAAGGKPAPITPAMQKKIMADAVRLLKWGKQWHELADLIARIAERPPVGEIRRILRTHKAEIELQAEDEE